MLACAKREEQGCVTDFVVLRKHCKGFSFFLEIVSSFFGKPIRELEGEKKKENNAVYLNVAEYFQFSTVALKKQNQQNHKNIWHVYE